MLELGAELESRDLDKERLSEAELEELIGQRDYQEFLNPRNELFRTQNMKEHPPSRAEAIQLMAKEPNLIRRPVVIRGSQMVLGFDEEAYKKLLKQGHLQQTFEMKTCSRLCEMIFSFHGGENKEWM